MSKRHTLEAHTRESKAGSVRRAGAVPGVLYGHGIAPQSVQVDARVFGKIYQEAGTTSLVNLTVNGGREHPVLVREVQRHPVRGTIIHVDFYQVRMDEAIRARVPLRFIGEAPAVKDLGGVLVRSMDEVELEALPADLPHDIEVDISCLDDFEKIIHISDLRLPGGVTLFHEYGDVVALVQPPRTEEELEELEEEVSEDVEEVEGVVEEEEAEGEEKGEKGEQAKQAAEEVEEK